MGKVIKWRRGGVTVTRTFHPKTLARDIDKIMLAAENTFGARLNDEIQNGIDTGTDINQKSFKKLHPKTLERRSKKGQGNKILEITGKMKRTDLIKAKTPGTGWKIIAKTPYARTHNEGLGHIPQRKWFGWPKDFKIPNGKEWIKTKILALKQMERAFGGYGFKSLR